MTGVATVLLLCVPFIPGLRDIPRLIPVHRLIWRHWDGPAPQPAAGNIPAPEPAAGNIQAPEPAAGNGKVSTKSADHSRL
jgi:hypothetical protein